MEIDIKLIEESIISTIKSISANSDIKAEFELEYINLATTNQENFLTDSNPVRISLPRIGNGSKERIRLARAVADLVAAYLSFHQNQIHQKYNLYSNNYKQLFDNFEKFRLIVKISKSFKGSKKNIIKLLEDIIDEFNDKNTILPFLLLEQVGPEFTKIKEHISLHKKFISEKLLTKINNLSKKIDDQELFAQNICKIIDFLEQDIEKSSKENSNNHENKKEKEEDKPKRNEKESEKDQTEDIELNKGEQSTTGQIEENKKLSAPEDKGTYQEIKIDKPNYKKDEIKFIPTYKIFTKKYDKIIKAELLSDKSELLKLRNLLDIKLKKIDKISNVLASKLKRKLLSKKNTDYEYNKEEGVLDRKKINQIVTKPLIRNNYVKVNSDKYQDTIVSLLIDNSGSMRGMPIIMSIGACEIITKILERFSIKTEILGFTTSEWRGGQSKKLWEKTGKIKNPGRLSDILHIIYKNADQSFKKSQINLALMIKEGLLKENIDGEALEWAKDRLLSRSEQRKILIVISDGTPVDDSTNSFNDTNILSDHLHKTINSIEKHSKIEVAAIGIGHNVGDFYQNSITINNLEDLGDVMINKICDLL